MANDEGNYARELVFNPNIGDKYLQDAQALYDKGYAIMKKYQGVADASDPFVRDPYKVFLSEGDNSYFRQDFADAQVYFDKCYTIFTRKLQWDDNAIAKPQYKELLQKLTKGMVYSAIYARSFFKANEYLDAYMNAYPDDKDFGLRWKLRVITIIIDQQEKYNVWMSGAMSSDYWRGQYKDVLKKYLATQNYSERTRKFIEDQVLPKYSEMDLDMTTIDTNFK